MCKKSIVCRVCLEPQQNDYVSLSEKYRNFVLYEFINTITSLKIRLSDGFTDKICTACHSQLISSIDFKEKCEASDVILKSNAVILKSNKVKQELSAEDKNLSIKSEVTGKAIKIEYEDENCDDNFDCSLDVEREQDLKQEKDEECRVFIAPAPDKPSRAIDLKLICDDCGGSFKSKCKLKVHWKKTHMYDNLVCEFCKRAFKSYKAFHQHKKRKTKSCAIAGSDNVTVEGVGRARMFCCKHCDYRSKRAKDMTAHIVIHTGDRPFECNICLKSYTQLSSLQGHQEIAHQMYVLQMTCHLCGKFVKGRRRVSRHLRSHTQVECPVCHKNFNKVTYPQHIKRHSGTKSYACEKCASTFYTMSELCNHRRFKHTKTLIRCEQCDFTCSREQVMKNHRIKHGSNNIPCTTCGRFYLTNEKLLIHQKVHYAEKKHSCTHCESRFFKRDSLRRHLKTKHADIMATELKATPLVVKTEFIAN